MCELRTPVRPRASQNAPTRSRLSSRRVVTIFAIFSWSFCSLALLECSLTRRFLPLLRLKQPSAGSWSGSSDCKEGKLLAAPPLALQSTHKTSPKGRFSDLVPMSEMICFTCMLLRAVSTLAVAPLSLPSDPFGMMFLCLCLGKGAKDSVGPPPFSGGKMTLTQFRHGLR